jgi:hypothetical protein
MTTISPGLGRLLAGCGGALLVVSLFLPWAEGAGGGSRSGWELLTVTDVLLLITALAGLAAAITGGRFGFFRPDLSLNATADILGLVSAILLACLLLFDWPTGASREVGAYLALAAAAAISVGAGDFKITSLFPRLPAR